MLDVFCVSVPLRPEPTSLAYALSRHYLLQQCAVHQACPALNGRATRTRRAEHGSMESQCLDGWLAKQSPSRRIGSGLMGHLASRCRPSSASLVHYPGVLMARHLRCLGWPSAIGAISLHSRVSAVGAAGVVPSHRIAAQLPSGRLGGRRVTRSQSKIGGSLGGTALQSLSRARGG